MKDYITPTVIISDGEIDLTQPSGFQDEDYFFYDVCLHNTNIIIGDVNYEDSYRDTLYMGNVGYTIYKDYRGHNYAIKALKLLKKILEENNKKEMLLNINPDNEASKKVATNFGAKFVCYRNIPKDHILYNCNSEHGVLVYNLKLNNKAK